MDEFLNDLYTFEEIIDKRPYSMTIKAKDKVNGKTYAIKKVIANDNLMNKLIIREIKILMLLKDNEYTVKYKDAYKNKNIYYIVTEFLESYVTLYEYIKINYIILPEKASLIFDNMIKGLKSIHDSGFVHRDIKIDNIMVNPATFEIKYIDFGAADAKETFKRRSLYTTPYSYLNPKLVNIDYDDLTLNMLKISDLFSLGTTFYLMMTKEYFFDKYKMNKRISFSTLQNEILKYPIFIESPLYKEYALLFDEYYKLYNWIESDHIKRLNEYRRNNNLKEIDFDRLFLANIESEPIYE